MTKFTKKTAKGKLKGMCMLGLPVNCANFVLQFAMHACKIQRIGQVFWMNVDVVCKLGSLDMNSPSQNMIQVVL